MSYTLPQAVSMPQPHLLEALTKGFEEIAEQHSRRKQATSLGKVLGLGGEDLESFANLSPDQQKLYTDYNKKAEAEKTKKMERQQTLKGGLETINRQRQLLQGGHLGSKFAIFGTGRKWGSGMSKQGIKDRLEYETLGKSLIPLASSIKNIRNLREFNVLSAKLYDPYLKQEEIAGVLDGMEKIIQNSLTEEGEGEVEYTAYAKNPQTGARLGLTKAGKWQKI